MNKKPFFSIIISNKNALKWLDKCFCSLQKQTFKNSEVIFIDNASTDTSVSFVEKNFPSVKILQNIHDLGPGVAMNIAAKKAKGDYLFLMNTDSYIDPSTLQQLAQVLSDHPEYELVELNMKNYEKTNMQDPPYKFGMDIFGYPMPSDKLFYADACGVAIKRTLYEKLNGFDETFYMYLDDLDFSWRARLLGTIPILLDDLYIFHHTGGTSIATSSHYHKKNQYTTTLSRRYHAQKNNLRILIKNYSLPMLLITLPVSVLLAMLEGWMYLLRKNTQGFIAMHRSILWNIVHISDTLNERKKIQSIRKVSDSEILVYCEKKIAKLHSLKMHGVPLMK